MGYSTPVNLLVLLAGLSFLGHHAQASKLDFGRFSKQEKLVVRFPRSMAPPGSNSLSSTSGNCSAKPVLLTVVTEADLYSRLTMPPFTTVYLYISNSIALSKPLNMSGPAWACTSIRPLNSGSNPTLSYLLDDQPAVLIWNTNNVFLFGVSIKSGASERSPACAKLPDFGGTYTCPALFIWNSFGVKIFSGSIHGRTDVSASTTTHIDSMTLFAPSTNQTKYPTASSCFGVVRFLYCGDPVNLVRSDNVLSNSDISGTGQGVVMYYMTVGVTVRNNEIHNFTWMGIQCGQNVHNVADCMLNTISNNLIYTEPFVNSWGDGAGIYFDTHWANPGNLVSCNHIKGGKHCLYFDYSSSGIKVEGGICEGTMDGVKINSGKNNNVASLIHYNVSYTVGLTSCQNPSVNNCLKDPGSYWMQSYNQFYRSAAWDQIAPFLGDLCSQTSVNGYLCNPPNTNGSDATFTGNCSGLPTSNSIQHIIVDGNKLNAPYFAQCTNYTNIPFQNSVTSFPVTGSLMGFDGLSSSNFGVSNYQSPIYSMIPNFKSCPKSSIGIQKSSVLSLSSQMAAFNLAQPTVQLSTVSFKATFKAHYKAAEFHDYRLLMTEKP